MTFVADGVPHDSRAADGHVVRTRLSLERAGRNERLVFSSSGRTETIKWCSRPSTWPTTRVCGEGAEGLDQPRVIEGLYDLGCARWELLVTHKRQCVQAGKILRAALSC